MDYCSLQLDSSLTDLILNPASNKIPRPPNSFMIFAREHRKILSIQNPEQTNKYISKVLGQKWRDLDLGLKQNYFMKAKMLDDLHRRSYPDYYYSPREARLRKIERNNIRAKCLEKSKTIKLEPDVKENGCSIPTGGTGTQNMDNVTQCIENVVKGSEADEESQSAGYVPNNPDYFQNLFYNYEDGLLPPPKLENEASSSSCVYQLQSSTQPPTLRSFEAEDHFNASPDALPSMSSPDSGLKPGLSTSLPPILSTIKLEAVEAPEETGPVGPNSSFSSDYDLHLLQPAAVQLANGAQTPEDARHFRDREFAEFHSPHMMGGNYCFMPPVGARNCGCAVCVPYRNASGQYAHQMDPTWNVFPFDFRDCYPHNYNCPYPGYEAHPPESQGMLYPMQGVPPFHPGQPHCLHHPPIRSPPGRPQANSFPCIPPWCSSWGHPAFDHPASTSCCHPADRNRFQEREDQGHPLTGQQGGYAQPGRFDQEESYLDNYAAFDGQEQELPSSSDLFVKAECLPDSTLDGDSSNSNAEADGDSGVGAENALEEAALEEDTCGKTEEEQDMKVYTFV